jgi:hypothetical protein
MKFNLFLVVFLLICHCCLIQAQSKDHKNNIILWTSGGYSIIMNDAPRTKALGNVGISLGGGYEMHLKHFLLQTGIEISYYRSRMNLHDSLYIVPMFDTEGTPFNGHFTFRNNYSLQRIINTSIPIMLGYKSDEGYYFLMGGKFSYNWNGNSTTYTNVTSEAQYNNIVGSNNNGVISGMPNHGLNTEKRTVENLFNFNFGFTSSFEAGFQISKRIDHYGKRNNANLRLALFCDYGVLPFNNKYRSDNLIIDISKTSMYMPALNGFLFFNTKSNVLNSVFVGVKLTKVFGIKENICQCNIE